MEPITIDRKESRLRVAPEWADVCFTCGTCAGGCPVSGVDGMDPRKVIRMAALGLDQELIDSRFSWICTMCGRCEYACPQGVEILQVLRRVRGLRDRDKVPGPIHKGVVMDLERGNNLGIPTEDFLFLLADLSKEMDEDGFPGFYAPVDKKGANILVTINSKEPFAEPDDMKFWWKIFYAAKEDWTTSSRNWEGVNWGLFSGDDESMKTLVGRIVEHLEQLECKTLLLPEWGHAYYATRLGLQKWFPEVFEKYRVMSVHDLLKEYLETGRIKVNKTAHKELTTLHDPCNYGRKSQKSFNQAFFEEPRWITQQCCENYVEMHPNRMNAYCCGAGGGAWAMPYDKERIYYGRVKARQIKDTGAKLVIAPCHNCRDQIMKSLTKEYDLDIETKYLWELVADSLVVEPWSDEEIKKANELRDAQYKRDDIDLSEEF